MAGPVPAMNRSPTEPGGLATPDDEPEPHLGLLVHDADDRPGVHPVELRNGVFQGRLRQRRDGQEEVEVVLVALGTHAVVGRVVLARPPRERGAPVVVEVDATEPARVTLRAWAEDDAGYVEATFPVAP